MRPIFALCLTAALVSISLAQEKTQPAPSLEQQVMALVTSVQNDLKSEKRAEAAEVLAKYDGTQFPEIAPVLIQVLERDSDPHVRKEAAKSLGKVKPTSVEALDALNHAAEKDPVLKVRLAARMARTGYKAPHPPTLPQAPIGSSPPSGATAKSSTPLPVSETPKGKWSDKLIFWKKKPTTPSSDTQVPILTKPQAPAALPKAPKGEDGPLLLPPPPSENPK